MITTRFKLVPDFTFEEWCKKKKIKVPESGDLGMAVMGMSGSTTRRTAGKQKANLKKMRIYNEIYYQYLSELTYIKTKIPLNPDNAADQAYIRVMEKRKRRQCK